MGVTEVMLLLLLELQSFGFKMIFEPVKGEIPVDLTTGVALFAVPETHTFRLLSLFIVPILGVYSVLQKPNLQVSQVLTFSQIRQYFFIDIIALCLRRL